MRFARLMAVLALVGSSETMAASRHVAALRIAINIRTVAPDAYVCAGICPWYSLTIDTLGHVIVREGWGEVYRYRASAWQLTRFEQLLSRRVGRYGEHPVEQNCGSDPEIQIRWFGPRAYSPFCAATASPSDGIFKAIDALGVSPLDGLPITVIEHARRTNPINWH